jgi:hypothetical protein
MSLKLFQIGKQTAFFEKDPITKVSKKLKYSFRDFSDEFYKRFFSENNTLVERAIKYGIELENYEKFYETGLRVSQQCDGRLRDINWDLYDSLRNNMTKQVAAVIENNAKKSIIEDLEQIISEELMSQLPEKDRARVSDFVSSLIEKPLSFDWDKITKSYRPLKIKFEVYEEHIRSYPALAERYAKLPSSARADFMELARLSEFNSGYPFDYFREGFQQEDLIKPAKNLSEKETALYFRALRMEIAREDSEFHDFFTYINYFIEGKDSFYLTPEQRTFYFEMLVKAQEENLEDCREYLPGDLAKLVGPYTLDEARIIADEVFNFGDGYGDIKKYLESKLKERKTD